MGNPFRRRITTVGTQVQRVIEDEALPDAVRSGVIKAIFNDGDIPDYVMEECVASISNRAERLYDWANNNYWPGMPSGEVYSTSASRNAIETIVEAAERQQVLLDYVQFGAANALHIGFMKLVQNWGYVESTNQFGVLSAQKGKPVYLKDMRVVTSESIFDSLDSGVFEQWGQAPTAGPSPERPLMSSDLSALVLPGNILIEPVTSVRLRVTAVWNQAIEPVRDIREEVFEFGIEDFDLTADWFHAKYYVNNIAKWWIYKDGVGTYPTLDNLFDNGPQVSGDYYPFLYFRWNKAKVSDNANTEFASDCRYAAKRLGIDFDLIEDAVHDNPNIGDVENAFMMFGVPAVSTDPVENRYLFDYFDTQYYAMGSQGTGLTYELGARHASVIQDQLFKMSLSNEGLTKRLRSGNLGPVGTHTSLREIQLIPAHGEHVNVFGETSVYQYDLEIPVHRYRKQVAEGLYEEITVRDLRMTYWIFNQYTATTDGDADVLLIPLDRSIAKGYPVRLREVLYSRALHFVFNSLVITNVKWYATGLFKLIMIVVAIAITIYTYGADGGSAIATALGLSGSAGLIATIVVNLVIGQLITSAFQLFVKVFGTEIAAALAVLAVIYGAYQVAAAGSLTGTWAKDLLSLSNGLQQAITRDRLDDLIGEVADFRAEVQEQQKLLDEAAKLLDSREVLSPWVIFGETPENYFNRTVHFGNIGTLGINAVSSYVDLALTLPKLNDTLGNASDEQLE